MTPMLCTHPSYIAKLEKIIGVIMTHHCNKTLIKENDNPLWGAMLLAHFGH